MNHPAIYGHRGASAYALENTWEAFKKAHELRIGIELDVQITKDGVVLVFHDDNLKRLSGKNMDIASVNYGLIKDMNIGKRGMRKFSQTRIPLAYEVFLWAKNESVPLNIEMKESFAIHPDGPEILAAMLEGMGEIHLSSFNPKLLKKMKELKPGIETALVVRRKAVFKRLEKMSWIDSIHLHKRLYTKKLAENLGSLYKNIRVYGIVGKEQIFKNPPHDLSGIITGYPEKVREKIESSLKYSKPKE